VHPRGRDDDGYAGANVAPTTHIYAVRYAHSGTHVRATAFTYTFSDINVRSTANRHKRTP